MLLCLFWLWLVPFTTGQMGENQLGLAAIAYPASRF